VTTEDPVVAEDPVVEEDPVVALAKPVEAIAEAPVVGVPAPVAALVRTEAPVESPVVVVVPVVGPSDAPVVDIPDALEDVLDVLLETDGLHGSPVVAPSPVVAGGCGSTPSPHKPKVKSITRCNLTGDWLGT
jgi:hypothetical protein